MTSWQLRPLDQLSDSNSMEVPSCRHCSGRGCLTNTAVDPTCVPQNPYSPVARLLAIKGRARGGARSITTRAIDLSHLERMRQAQENQRL